MNNEANLKIVNVVLFDGFDKFFITKPKRNTSQTPIIILISARAPRTCAVL